VIDGGTIVEDGSPKALLERENSRFSHLISLHTNSSGERASSDSHVPADVPADQVEDTGDGTPETSLSVAVSTTASSHSEEARATEERARGAVTRGVILDYIGKFTPFWWGVVTLLILCALRQSATVSTDLWLASGTQGRSVLLFLGTYLILVATLCSLNFVRALFVLSRGLATGIRSHTALLHGVLRAPLQFFESTPVGRILNRFSNDIDTIEGPMPRSILDLLNCVFDVVTLAIVVLVVQPLTFLLIVPLVWCYYQLQRLYRPTAREGSRLESLSRSPLYALLAESLVGVESIRASQLVRQFQQRFYRHLEHNGRVNFSLTAANRWIGVRLESVGALMVLTIAISSILPWQPQSAPAVATGLILTYALSISSALNWLIRSVSMLESQLTSYERVQEYIQLPSERLAGPNPPPDWPHSGAVRLQNVSVRYRADLPFALKGVSCSITPGSRIGIVGRTGSGKSTLVLALLRLVELNAGCIEIDGVDISNVRLDLVRQAVTVVPQEPVLFSGTIRDNLDPFHRHDDAEIAQALTRAELVQFIDSLPSGLSTLVQESGRNLSCGQRQLLCLARAILERSRIIILDEATASIDVETDAAIQRTLRREFSDATLFVIAHRLGTVLDSDKIMVLSLGELQEFGPPDQVLQKGNLDISGASAV
jgi:ABC-type multidrug transport system fused ATPase/permease subunit